MVPGALRLRQLDKVGVLDVHDEEIFLEFDHIAVSDRSLVQGFLMNHVQRRMKGLYYALCQDVSHSLRKMSGVGRIRVQSIVLIVLGIFLLSIRS